MPHPPRSTLARLRLRLGGTALAAAVVTASTAACYTTRPLLGPPAAGTEIEATLNDRGRAALADSLGRDVDLVAGRVVERTDTSLVLALTRVRTFRGAENTWTGEQVRFSMTSLRSLAERRLSRAQSVLLGVGIVGATVGLILSRSLFGNAAGAVGDGPGGPPSGS
jgi:hypothetical protein